MCWKYVRHVKPNCFKNTKCDKIKIKLGINLCGLSNYYYSRLARKIKYLEFIYQVHSSEIKLLYFTLKFLHV